MYKITMFIENLYNQMIILLRFSLRFAALTKIIFVSVSVKVQI